MLEKGIIFFICIPEESSSQRVMYPAVITDFSEGIWTAEFKEPQELLHDEQEVLIYCEHNCEFMQQSASIAMVLIDGEAPVFTFTTTSKPVSAESRQCYRVCTVLANIKSNIDGQDGCSVLDISLTGFSASSSKVLQIGSKIPVNLYDCQSTYKGDAIVQSIKEMPSGRRRYGFYCSEIHGIRNGLTEGLRQISARVQREQLKRLRGTG